MKITEDLIKKKIIVGVTSWGSPIVMIETKGGLFAFFTKTQNNQIVTLSTAAHKAIGAWLAEKKDPQLKWYDNFLKYEESPGPLYARLRNLFFAPLLKHGVGNDLYFVYDTKNLTIGLMDKQTINDAIYKREIQPHWLIRNISLAEPIMRIDIHPFFRGLFYEEK